MKFLDLLYFSKGERRALTVLLALIVIAIILLMVTDRTEPPPPSPDPDVIASDTIRGDTSLAETPTSSSPKVRDHETTVKKVLSVKEFKRPAERAKNANHTYPVKFSKGTLVELNSADTTILKKVPGIGAVFSKRIIKYRDILGGFYSVTQLAEVYGIDEERFHTLKAWFVADSCRIRSLYVNSLPADSLARHPYINYRQARIIERMRKRNGPLPGWEALSLLEEFSVEDITRLKPYVSFEVK